MLWVFPSRSIGIDLRSSAKYQLEGTRQSWCSWLFMR